MCQIVGYEERTYFEGYKAAIPVTSDYTFTTGKNVAVDKTTIIDCGKITIYNGLQPDSEGQEKRLLVLVKPSIVS